MIPTRTSSVLQEPPPSLRNGDSDVVLRGAPEASTAPLWGPPLVILWRLYSERMSSISDSIWLSEPPPT